MSIGNSSEISQNDQGTPLTELNSETRVIERIKQLQKQKIKNGELVETPIATYHFPFLNDERFLTSPNKNELKELLSTPNTLSVSQEAIKYLDIRDKVEIIRLIPDEEHRAVIIPGLGIGGRASLTNEVKLYFLPNDPNILESLAKWNSRQIVHELTHVARRQSVKKENSLLEAMIDEGLATYYEEHWRDKYVQTPWGHALTQEQLKKEWAKAQDEMSISLNSQKHGEWFFGINNVHPRWSGYSLGNAIINTYFQNHPHAEMAEVVKIVSKDILKDSNFILV